MSTYLEVDPPPSLAEAVECLWIHNATSAGTTYRVVPDACADIIYTRTESCANLRFVAAMTRFEDFAQSEPSVSVGVRFRPSMWGDIFRINGTRLADRVMPLEDIWGCRAAGLISRLEAQQEPEQFGHLLLNALPPIQPRSSFQKAVAAIEREHGDYSLELAATAACLSTRQFRRRCLEATSLTPKLLARVLRFRRASSLAASMKGHHSNLAAECGYADQSHWISECRRFGGHTPSSEARSSSVTIERS